MKPLDLFKENKTVIIIAGILLVLILLRAAGMDHFRNDARKWAVPSVNESNIITHDKLEALPGEHMIISLDNASAQSGENTRIIPADSILNRENLRSVMKHDGPVVLASSDPGLSARIWMLLSQMGRENLYIVSDSANEVLKFRLEADSTYNRN